MTPTPRSHSTTQGGVSTSGAYSGASFLDAPRAPSLVLRFGRAAGLEPTDSAAASESRQQERSNVALTDDELNDFDRTQIVDWDPKDAQRARNDHPDLYRNHLTIAKMIDAWIVNLPAEDNDYYRGIVRAQQDIEA